MYEMPETEGLDIAEMPGMEKVEEVEKVMEERDMNTLNSSDILSRKEEFQPNI